MTGDLETSFEYCRAVARKRARNFYYSFVLLPAPQRRAMCAIYAFMRYCDDLSDAPGAGGETALRAIERWHADLEAALDGRLADHPLWPAFHDTVVRYRIPAEYFRDMIAGVSSDVEPRTIATFDELYRYCYQVASVVGLTVIHIFGFHSPDALPLAEKCGIAFQLTNILRDVREDAERGRVYLPEEDLRRFGVDPGGFAAGKASAGFEDLMRFEAARARAFYREAEPLIGLVDKSSRSSLAALIRIYSGLLDRMERLRFNVLAGRISLPARRKLWIAARAALGGR